MKWWLAWFGIFVSFVLLFPTEGARVKRCFVCRSRGELGDCRDPFTFNGTTVEAVKGVEAAPCASGWCAKILEGRKQDYAVATERTCLQRPPGDTEQRCANTVYEHRKVYMCFCKGDLCNSGNESKSTLTHVLGYFVFGYLLSSATRCL